ncbi:hypothetical protein [uncultured Pseudomonas sp.]|uniref:hypothetical protein n=1 Tax=uncultured Pseudomonas sp. TaxID=114707 RepID=UPI0025F5BA41|nr:hypothetical protein [uncultured Pseudomonas sp.]
MTAQLQQLTTTRTPKILNATGEFTATVDGVPIPVQTKTLAHDFDYGTYGITGRHADNSVTVKEFYIQLPEDVELDKIIRLQESEFTKVRVWYSVKSPTLHYVVQGIEGILNVTAMEHFATRIRCGVNARTDKNPSGNIHDINILFDLRT